MMQNTGSRQRNWEKQLRATSVASVLLYLGESRCNFFNQASSLCWTTQIGSTGIGHTCETSSHIQERSKTKRKTNRNIPCWFMWAIECVCRVSIFWIFLVFILFLFVGSNNVYENVKMYVWKMRTVKTWYIRGFYHAHVHCSSLFPIHTYTPKYNDGHDHITMPIDGSPWEHHYKYLNSWKLQDALNGHIQKVQPFFFFVDVLEIRK